MKISYWYKTCPFCRQGRLFVFKNLDIDELYLHCDECERGYLNPSNLETENSFLTLDTDFNAIEATMKDIKVAGWDKLELKQLVEKE
jgi:hypothetical protein